MVELKHLSPREVLDRGIVKFVSPDQIQQVGIDLTLKNDVEIPAHGFANVEVEQAFDMNDCFGLINIRSSFSRIGLFCSSGVYDPGFNGTGGLTIYNFGDKRFLQAGMRIAQILIFSGAFNSKYNGYYNQNKSIKSKENTNE